MNTTSPYSTSIDRRRKWAFSNFWFVNDLGGAHPRGAPDSESLTAHRRCSRWTPASSVLPGAKCRAPGQNLRRRGGRQRGGLVCFLLRRPTSRPGLLELARHRLGTRSRSGHGRCSGLARMVLNMPYCMCWSASHRFRSWLPRPAATSEVKRHETHSDNRTPAWSLAQG